MHPYDGSFDPPAPCLSVRLIHAHQPDASQTLSAQLDTGADITVVPQPVINRLGLLRVSEALIAGYDTAPTILPLYCLDLDIDGQIVRGVNAVAYSGDTLLLGRDVLNRFRTLLDGPALAFELTAPAEA